MQQQIRFKRSIILVCLLCLSGIITGCGSNESIITVKSQVGLRQSDYDPMYKLDSFKIVSVIDERDCDDRYLGVANRDGAALMLVEPVADYLLPRLNLAIVRDTSVKNYTPITVYVKDFNFGRTGSFYNKGKYFRFNLAFEYPSESGKKTFVMVDSVVKLSRTFLGDVELGDPEQAIKIGLLEAQRIFILNMQGKIAINNNTTVSWDSTSVKNSLYDSLNWSRTKSEAFKIGLNYKTRFGNKTLKSSSVELHKDIRLRNDYIIGTSSEFGYAEVSKKNKLGSITTIGFSYILGKNLFSGIESSRFQVNLQPYFGRESYDKKNNSIIGIIVDGSEGVDIFDYLSIDVGVFTQNQAFSKLFSINRGFTVSVGLNTGY